MALLWADKWNRYDAVAAIPICNFDVSASWVTATTGRISLPSTDGAYGDDALALGPNGRVALPWNARTANDVVIISTGFWYGGGSDGGSDATPTRHTAFLTMERASGLASGIHFGLEIGLGGAIFVLDQGGSIVGRAERVIQPQTWHRLEVKATLQNSGSVVVKIDGVQVLNVTGQDFLASSLSGAYLLFRGIDGRLRFHDTVIADGSGSTFNDFIGAVRLESNVPDGDGSTLQWTPSAGSNFQCIDDALRAVPADTDYISETTTNDINLATHPDFSLPNVDDILFAHLAVTSRATASSEQIALVAKSSSASAVTGDLPIPNSSSYRWCCGFFEQDPNTSAPWTKTNLNAAEFGVKYRT